MSDLQTALLALGAVIIVTVFIYNKWQEKRYQKSAERSFALKHDDVLVDVRPVQSEPPVDHNVAVTTAAGVARIEPQYEEPGPGLSREAESEAERQPRMEVPTSITPIDYCVTLYLQSETDSSKVIETAVKLLSDFNKWVHVDMFDSESSAWRSIEHGDICRIIRGCVQLVDRRGCIDAAQLARFDGAMRGLAVRLDALASEEGISEALIRAKDLDQFSTDVDIKVGLNVISTDRPFSGRQLLAAAATAGMELGADGGFHKRDESARSQYRLTNLGDVAFSEATLEALSTRAVTFEVDVPRAKPSPELVSNLFGTAVKFAAEVGGQVVDDNHLAIGEKALSSIRVQLDETYRKMQEHGFSAGESLALRLFS